MTESVWLDRPPEEGDAVQLINSKSGRMYAVISVLLDGRLIIRKKGWPGLFVKPERVRVLNRTPPTPPAGAVGMMEKEGE